MRVELFTLADNASEGEDGKLTIEGAGISHIRGPELPVRIPQIVVVMRAVLDETDIGEHDVRLTFRGPSGEVASSGDARLQVARPDVLPEGEIAALNLVIYVRDLDFTEYGPHVVEIEWDNTPLESRQLAVIQGPGPGRV